MKWSPELCRLIQAIGIHPCYIPYSEEYLMELTGLTQHRLRKTRKAAKSAGLIDDRGAKPVRVKFQNGKWQFRQKSTEFRLTDIREWPLAPDATFPEDIQAQLKVSWKRRSSTRRNVQKSGRRNAANHRLAK
jgi:hypothetical protein